MGLLQVVLKGLTGAGKEGVPSPGKASFRRSSLSSGSSDSPRNGRDLPGHTCTDVTHRIRTSPSFPSALEGQIPAGTDPSLPPTPQIMAR